MAISSANQFYVTFQSATAGIAFEGAFSKVTGGAVSKQSTPVRDGGSQQPERVSGFVELEDMVCERPYKRERDGVLNRQIVDELTRGGGKVTGVVSWSPTDSDLVPFAGEALQYEAELIKVEMPDVDADSADPSRGKYTFALIRKV